MSRFRNSLAYAGSLTHRGSVAPLSIVQIKSKAWVQRHGSYEAGDWRVEVTAAEGQFWRQGGVSRKIRFNNVGIPNE